MFKDFELLPPFEVIILKCILVTLTTMCIRPCKSACPWDRLDTKLKVCDYSSIRRASLKNTVDSKMATFFLNAFRYLQRRIKNMSHTYFSGYSKSVWRSVLQTNFNSSLSMVFCYQNCSYLQWEKIVLVIEKFTADGQEFAKILRSLEQFIQTVKCQNNFLWQNAFLTCSHI